MRLTACETSESVLIVLLAGTLSLTLSDGDGESWYNQCVSLNMTLRHTLTQSAEIELLSVRWDLNYAFVVLSSVSDSGSLT